MQYDITDGYIYVSNKYPNGLNRKRSEQYVDIQCNSCHSTDISSDKSGDMVTVCCHNCQNWWAGSIHTIINISNDGEVFVRLQQTDTFSAV